MKTIISYLLAFLFIMTGLILVAIKNPVFLPLLSPQRQIQWQWYTSHYVNSIEKRHPKALKKIKSSSIIYLSQKTKKLIKDLPLFLREENKKGLYNLEVQIVDWKHKKEKGVIVEYHLYDVKNENKVWEYGQTFQIY